MKTITVAFPLLLLVCHVSADLNTDLLQLTSELRSFILQTEVRAEQQQTEIDGLKKQLTVPAEQHAIDGLKKQLTVLAAQQQTEMDGLKKQLTDRQVAFSAALLPSGQGSTGPLNGNPILVFKHVVTNIGNAYNPVTGEFVAPLKGAYHFEWFIGGWGGTSTGAQLFKNNETIFLAFAYTKNRIVSTSNGASLLLNPGDKVVLRLWPKSVVYDNFNHHTTFSGHLLFTM